MISSILSRLVILVFGTLYPAYASYKTVRNKDLREYVKWMMYWVVFALFTCAETFTDVLLSFWFPFYYEFKIIVVFWLLLPATKGSSILYRKFVHPTLTKREKEIDEAIMNAKAQGYTTFLRLGARGLDYAKYVLMETAIKGGGGLMNQLRKSYSLSDLTDQHNEPRYRAIGLGSLQEEQDVVDHREDAQYMRRSLMQPAHRSGSVPNPMDMYFSELDLDLKQRRRPDRQPVIGHPQSMEDVSSGYSSADPMFSASQGNSPLSENGLEDILLRSSSIGSTQLKARKPVYSGEMDSASNKSSEGFSSLAQKLDEVRPISFVSPFMLSELKTFLSSRKGDIYEVLTSEKPSSPCQPTEVSGSSIVTKTSIPLQVNEGHVVKKMCVPHSTLISDASAVLNPSSKTQNSGRAELEHSGDVTSDGVQEKAARAGRYKKLKAPGPPSKPACDTENAGLCHSPAPSEDSEEANNSVKSSSCSLITDGDLMSV